MDDYYFTVNQAKRLIYRLYFTLFETIFLVSNIVSVTSEKGKLNINIDEPNNEI